MIKKASTGVAVQLVGNHYFNQFRHEKEPINRLVHSSSIDLAEGKVSW